MKDYNIDPNRFKITWAAEALQPQPPIPWIIEKLFAAGSVNLLVGEAGSKKTYALIDAAVCVACGKPWLEYPTHSSGNGGHQFSENQVKV
jgi:RecA-family ATPase